MENDVKTIVLNDEEGNEIEFDVITKLDIEDKEYVIVIPASGEEEDPIALRIDKDSEGNDVLVTIEDEEEFSVVEEAFELVMGEEDEYKN